MRLVDLAGEIDRKVGEPVDVLIVETIIGPRTQEQLDRLVYGQLEIRAYDLGAFDLALVPSAWRAGDPNRYKNKFDRVIEGPVRVRGQLLEDKEMSRPKHPHYVIRVDQVEAAPADPPSHAASPADLPRLDRRVVSYEGTYTTGFEVSTLDDSIWVTFGPGAKELGKSGGVVEKGRTRDRVRVTGVVYSRPGHRYGHLGGAEHEIVVSRLEYLDK
jgi:hypothetical protein